MCGYLLRSQLLTDFRRRERAESELTTCSGELSGSGFIRNLGRSKTIRHIDFAAVQATGFAEWPFRDDGRLDE